MPSELIIIGGILLIVISVVRIGRFLRRKIQIRKGEKLLKEIFNK